MIIRTLDQDDFEIAFNFAWNYQNKASSQTFPLHQSRTAIQNHCKNALILGAFDNDSLCAVAAFLVSESNLIIKAIAGPYYVQEAAGIALLDHVMKLFPNYEVFFEIMDSNTAVPAILTPFDPYLSDDCTVMLFKDGNLPNLKSIQLHIEALNDANRDLFCRYHDTVNPDIFWSSERILRDPKRWFIFLIRDGQEIVGAMTLKRNQRYQTEVITFDANYEQAYEFLNRCVRYLTEEGIESITFNVDSQNPVAVGAAVANGFKESFRTLLFQI